MAKPEENVKDRMQEVQAALQTTGEALDRQREREEERGTLLSSPSNTHGSPQAAITAALLNTQSAVSALESQQRDLFVQSKNLYFDKDLVGVPFMIIDTPHEEMRPDNFGKAGSLAPRICFHAWLLDPDYVTWTNYDNNGFPIVNGYNGPEPKPVDVEIAGAYVRNTLTQLPATILAGRVWTLDYNESVRTLQDQPARMLAFWKPLALKEQGTF